MNAESGTQKAEGGILIGGKKRTVFACVHVECGATYAGAYAT